MWKIKDPELKAKVNAFFSDEEINNAFVKNTDCYKYFRLSTNINNSCFTFAIDKDLMEFIPDYDPDNWNPYPQLTPPRSGLYFIYRTYEFENKITVDRYEEGKYGGRWSETAVKSILAFKECHLGKPEFLP